MFIMNGTTALRAFPCIVPLGLRRWWNHHIAKRNFPSCSLRSQVTASQKPPLLFPNAKKMEPSKWSHQIRKKKLPVLLTPFAIHCLTKATAFVPQCEKNGAIYW